MRHGSHNSQPSKAPTDLRCAHVFQNYVGYDFIVELRRQQGRITQSEENAGLANHDESNAGTEKVRGSSMMGLNFRLLK